MERQSLQQKKGTGRPRSALGRLLPFLGPAFIAAVAYIDPGNFATNISAGSQFGYALLWVILLSNLMAVLVQLLSAKLGIASGKNLAEQCRDNFPRPLVIGMWVLMELVAMATDIAEFLGAAVGLFLLFGLPFWVCGILTALVTFLILSLERFGFRPLELVITAFVAVIAASYLVELILVKPDFAQIATGYFVPSLPGPSALFLAVGIVGATVMPHAIYLHSALTQKRIVVSDPTKKKRLFRFERIDILIAMGLASLINAAMLILAAGTFHQTGHSDVGSLESAHQTLTPLLGSASSTIFGIALLASGLSSSSVGTMAGQVIMQGFLRFEVPIWLRRLVTMLPSLIIIAAGLDPSSTLVFSQVCLSFGLPFAIIPLVIITSKKSIMGELVNRRITTILAWVIAAIVVALNLWLLSTIILGVK